MSEPEKYALDLVRIDGGTQMRAALNEEVVAEYEQVIRAGGDFPPIKLFYDGTSYWLADGFHRFFGYKKAGALHLPAEVEEGTKRDAILYSVGANASHGLRRTNEDKRKAVLTLLEDEEWSAWSDREIARRSGVSNRFVSNLRPAPETQTIDTSVNGSQIGQSRTVERNGKTYQQNTSNIGADKKADAKAAKEERDAKQAENERQRKANEAQFSEGIQAMEAAKEVNRQKARDRRAAAEEDADDDLSPEDRIAELEEANRVLTAEAEVLRAENKLFGDMKVQWEQDGYKKVIAGLEEALRVAKERTYSEHNAMKDWRKRANFFQEQAIKLGWTSGDKTIDIKTGEMRDA